MPNTTGVVLILEHERPWCDRLKNHETIRKFSRRSALARPIVVMSNPARAIEFVESEKVRLAIVDVYFEHRGDDGANFDFRDVARSILRKEVPLVVFTHHLTESLLWDLINVYHAWGAFQKDQFDHEQFKVCLELALIDK